MEDGELEMKLNKDRRRSLEILFYGFEEDWTRNSHR